MNIRVGSGGQHADLFAERTAAAGDIEEAGPLEHPALDDHPVADAALERAILLDVLGAAR